MAKRGLLAPRGSVSVTRYQRASRPRTAALTSSEGKAGGPAPLSNENVAQRIRLKKHKERRPGSAWKGKEHLEESIKVPGPVSAAPIAMMAYSLQLSLTGHCRAGGGGVTLRKWAQLREHEAGTPHSCNSLGAPHTSRPSTQTALPGREWASHTAKEKKGVQESQWPGHGDIAKEWP